MLAKSYTPSRGTIDGRMIAVTRLVLALLALLITIVDPPEPDRDVTVTYATLMLYAVYSATLYTFARRQKALLPEPLTPWIDVGWYVVLIGLSSGTHSIFFFLAFFAILVASFRSGFVSGLYVTLASVVLFTVVGCATAPAGVPFELDRFLLRPLSVLILGYMIACWGGAEFEVKQRLALLKEVSTLSNPRFGIDRTLGSILERLRAFYNADACLLVTADHSRGQYSLRRASRHDPEASGWAKPVPEEFAGILLGLPAEQGLVYCEGPRLWGWRHLVTATQRRQTGLAEGKAALAHIQETLVAESFVTVPFRSAGEIVGRLYLTSSRRRCFTDTDVDFLLYVLDHTIPVLNNLRLVDCLASDAARSERQRIAHMLHDSVIQSCTGLRMGLAAVLRKFCLAGTAVGDEIERAMQLSDAAIADLRHCISGLGDSRALAGGLLPGLQRFVKQFAEATGIAVQVKAEGNVSIHDRLAAEVVYMVSEGLSNVRRHTSSTRATVALACHDGQLTVRIENDGVSGKPPAPFTPRSLAERTAALGGSTRVTWTDAGTTVVHIDIPL